MEKRKMSLKEAEQLNIMQQIDKKIFTLRQASEELALSLRHTKRILKRYRLQGAEWLISKHVGKISPNRIDPKIQVDILKILYREEYANFELTFARDKIEERHGHCLSSETIRKWMVKRGLWTPKTNKRYKIHPRRLR